jgi:protoporphyrinogen oxidase
VYLNNRIIPYPVQYNVKYLPAVLRIKSLTGSLIKGKKEPRNLEEWFIYNFGWGLHSIFFKPYNEKLWKYPLKKIVPDFLTSYVPKSSRGSKEKSIGYNAEFLYPKKGIGELMSSLSKGIKVSRGEVRKVDEKYVYFDSKKTKYENLVSTIPLPEFLNMLSMYEEKFEPKNGDLVWNSVLCLNIGVKGKLSFGDSMKRSKNSNLKPTEFHWIYFPDKGLPFYRVGSLSNISSQFSPEGCSSIWVEISYRRNKPKDDIVDVVIRNLVQMGLFKKEAIDHISELDIPYAYPIYDENREKILKEIQNFLNRFNITLAGRFGKWQYSYIEESILEGKRIAEKLCR